MKKGSLAVVGTGYLAAGHVTAESQTLIESAEKCLYMVADPAAEAWIRQLNATAESLKGCYAPGKPRLDSYREMVERMLTPVRQGLDVCAVFYGHPGVFAFPPHEAIRQARAAGFEARMFPGVSAEDCLFADLGLDPAIHGCQSFEATDFLVHQRRFDPTSNLILWQAGGIGVATYEREDLWSRSGLRVLAEVLLQHYPAGHQAVVYEAAVYPVCDPLILHVPLGKLAEARVSVISTLYLPPLRTAPLDLDMLDRLGISRPSPG
ncbi:MAG TPA: SAM-dependent methyltransferase [Vicinamibacteria bacterium]|nr:SAM-dependent methyltransferase [Vicinamibacteria bacterium]